MATQSVRIGWRPYVNVVTQVVNAVDADAQAFISAAGITNLTQAAAINTLVNDLKTYGLWTKMKAIYPFVGGSATSHKFNLKDPRDLDAAYRLVFNGGWIHSLNGATPNGTTGYADTKFIPSTNLGAYSVHLSYYSRTNRTYRNSIAIGAWQDSPTHNNIDLRLNGNNAGPNGYSVSAMFDGWDGLDYASYATTRSDYFLIGSKTAINLNKVYENGLLKGTNTTTSTRAIPNVRVLIGAESRGTTGVTNYDNLESAFASIGDGLTDTDATNFYNSVQKFNSTLGRQIGSPFVSDTDAQAFLNAAAITDLGQANAVNTLVVDLKAAGVWTKMKAIYPFVGGTATTHKFNLKDPRDVDAAYRLTFVGGWTHTGAGALSNGTTGYANTNINANQIFTSTDGLMGIYTPSSLINSTYIYGVSNMADSEWGMYYGSGSLSFGMYRSNTVSSSTTLPGFSAVGMETNGHRSVYKNNSRLTSTAAGFIPMPQNLKMYLSARNANGNVDGFSSGLYSFSFISSTLTLTEYSAFYTAVQKYQTSLGRQVGTPVLESGQTAGLLENYPSATAAYSLRKLRAGYNGYAIRVRRSSDNTEQDISFNSDGTLDTTSLLAFVGTGNGFVTTWYDQSGNGYGVSHITASQQPEIVVSGSLITNLGKVSIRFGLVSGGVTYLQNSSLSLNTPDITIIYLGNKINSGNSLNAYSTPIALRTSSTQDWNNINNIGTRMVKNGNIGLQYNSTLYSQTYSFNTSYLMWNQKINNNFSVGKNGNTFVTNIAATSANITSNLLILGGTIFNGDSYLNGYLSEVIIYASNQSSNRTGIESNINSYYSIY